MTTFTNTPLPTQGGFMLRIVQDPLFIGEDARVSYPALFMEPSIFKPFYNLLQRGRS